MAYENLTYEQRGHVALVTLNRPEKLNALNHDLQEETRAVCAAVEADDEIRVMIVTGEGRGFCSGADLTSGRSANGAGDCSDIAATLACINLPVSRYNPFAALSRVFAQVERSACGKRYNRRLHSLSTMT